MPNTPPAFNASGDIRPLRFCTVSGQHTVAESNANEAIVGVSKGGTNYPPLSDLSITALAAASGQPVEMLGDGEVGYITAGGSFSAGGRLKSDADGKAVAIATSGNTVQQVGAVALEDSGGDGQIVRVQVQLGAQYAPS